MGRFIGWSSGIALAVAIGIIIPGDQNLATGFLLGYSLGGFGLLLGKIADNAQT